MTDERLRDAYERGLPSGTDRPLLDDLSAERLRRVVDREGDERERLHMIDQLLSTAGGRADLDLAWAAAHAARPPSRRRWWGLVAATAGLVLLPAVWLTARDPAPVMRSGGEALVGVAPRGAVARGELRFTWHARPGYLYRLVVVGPGGEERYAAETTDTVVTLPDSVRLSPEVDHQWWVDARGPAGEQVSSTPITIRLAR
ncbi:MAG: hypothetical protein JNL26_04630 [Gemmatimonadetes bacterium]|nr:hypothetical protein [Gemmatimonadota bacterium]